MLCALPPTAPDDATYDQRHMQRATEHIAAFGRDVDELVHTEQKEVHANMHMDGAHSGKGGADGHSGHPIFGKRGVENAVCAEFLRQSFCGAVDAAKIVYALSQNQHTGVACHLLFGGLMNGLSAR